MRQSLKMHAAAAVMLLAAALPARRRHVTADDTARFLAGMPPSADSPLMPLTKEPAWQRHAKFFDNAFGQLEQRQLSKIRAWSESPSRGAAADHVLHVQRAGLPLRRRVLSEGDDLCAERAGAGRPVPDLTELPRGGVGAALYNVERSLGSILSFSFFITKQMKTDLQRRPDQRHLADPLRVPGALGQDHPRASRPIALDDKGRS